MLIKATERIHFAFSWNNSAEVGFEVGRKINKQAGRKLIHNAKKKKNVPLFVTLQSQTSTCFIEILGEPQKKKK